MVNVSETELLAACTKGDAESCASLVASGASPNALINGLTPLVAAAAAGHTEVLAKLVELKADVDGEVGGKATPLIIATLSGQLPVVQKLLSLKASVDRPTSNGHTALAGAASTTNDKIVKALIDGKADVALETADGDTPLCVAAACGSSEATHLLLASGASVNHEAKDGATPLIEASGNGNAIIIDTLCGSKEIDINFENKEGVTALMAAVEAKHHQVTHARTW